MKKLGHISHKYINIYIADMFFNQTNNMCDKLLYNEEL